MKDRIWPSYRNRYSEHGRQLSDMMQGADDIQTRHRAGTMVRRCGDHINVWNGNETKLFVQVNLGDSPVMHVADDLFSSFQVGKSPMASLYAQSDKGDLKFGMGWAGLAYGTGGSASNGSIPVTFSGSAPGTTANITYYRFPLFLTWTDDGYSVKQGQLQVDQYGFLNNTQITDSFSSSMIPFGKFRNGEDVVGFAGLSYCGLNGDSSRVMHAYIRFDAADFSAGFGANLLYNSLPLFGGEMMVLAPGVLLSVDRYHRSSAALDGIYNPGWIFTYSKDGGTTWAQASDGMSTPDLAPILAQGYMAGYVSVGTAWFALNHSFMSVAPLSPEKAVMLSFNPYLNDSRPAFIGWRLQMGTIDTAGHCAITKRTVIEEVYDGLQAHDNLIGSYIRALAVKEGVLLFVPESIGYGTAPWKTRHLKIMLTTDGIALQQIGVMPKTLCLTGEVSGYDENTLMCPMWDAGDDKRPEGVYLFTTRDLGATWVRRGLIYACERTRFESDSIPYRLSGVSQVVVSMIDGIPQPSFPAAPWSADCTYANPIR